MQIKSEGMADMTDEEIKNLLPWYINGTLSEAERKAVEGLLERSEPAINELVFLQRLSQNLQEQPAAPDFDLGWRRLRRDIQNESRAKTQSWWKPGLAVAATLIMALQIGILVQRPTTNIGTRLLGQGPVTSTLQGPHWHLQIEFRDDSNWGEISGLITRLGGTITEGPSSIGLLHIAVPENNAEFQSAQELLFWLLQQPQVSHAAIESD